MKRIYAIANQKGGVGKTTTAINLGACLAQMGKRVLLVDLDPQANATIGVGMAPGEPESLHVLLDEKRAADAIASTDTEGLDILPTSKDLTAAEVELLKLPLRELRLSRALAQVHDSYDYIIIDCPPALNLLTVNALMAANGVIIPVQCEYYALEGLGALQRTIKALTRVNKNLRIEGIVRTMLDSRNILSRDVTAQLREHFGERLYNSAVPRNVRLAEAPSYGQHILKYDANCSGAVAYMGLAGEVIRRVEGGK